MTDSIYICNELLKLEKENIESGRNFTDAVYICQTIQVIDSVRVEVQITSSRDKNSNHKLSYHIYAKKIYRYFYVNRYDKKLDYNLYSSKEFGGNTKLSVELVEILLNQLKEKLKNFKLDKTFGKLVTEKCQEAFMDYIDGENCCICFEKTITKTSCQHFLCIKCWDELRKTSKKCPICRRAHFTIFDDYVFTDDDEV